MSELTYAYQDAGAEFMAAAPTGRSYCGDEPGLGKTRTVIRALELSQVHRPLVVCPAIVRSHWLAEFDTMGWYEHSQRPIVKSYDEIVRGGNALMRDLFLENRIDGLACDEAHALKHPSSKRTQQILGKDGYARRLMTVFMSSGTPIPKNPLEFWPTLATLWPEIALTHGLKTEDDFVKRFCVQRHVWGRGQMRVKTLAIVNEVEEFNAIKSQVMIARSLKDVGLDVPQIQWQLQRINAVETPTLEQPIASAIHNAIAVGELDAIADDPHVARMRRKLGVLKAPIVAHMLYAQLIESDEKIVVFAHHREVLNILEEELMSFGVSRVDGSTSDNERGHQKHYFTYGTNRVFLAQNIACKEGLDGLQQVAHRGISVEPDWTAMNNYQMGKRLARIGQDEGRVIMQMVALAGTLDESIVAQNVKETRMVAELGLGKELVMT